MEEKLQLYPEDVIDQEIIPEIVTSDLPEVPVPPSSSQYNGPLQNVAFNTWSMDQGLPNSKFVRECVKKARFRPISWKFSAVHPYAQKYLQPVVDICNHLFVTEGRPHLHVELNAFSGSSSVFSIVHDLLPLSEDEIDAGIRTTSIRRSSNDQEECIRACLIFFEPPGSLERYAIQETQFGPKELPDTVLLHWARKAFEKGSPHSINHFVVSDTRITLLLWLPSTTQSPNNPFNVSYMVHDVIGGGLRVALARIFFGYLDSSGMARDIVEGSYASRGAPNRPGIPPPSTAQLVSSRRSFDDFDVYAMKNDEKLTLFEGFLKWNKEIQLLGKKEAIGINTALTGIPNLFSSFAFPSRSPRPLHPLPYDTAELVEKFRRPRSKALDRVLAHPFKLEIVKVLRTGPDHWSQVFVARIIDRPGHTELPLVCVKLYDERFFATPQYSTWEHPIPLATYNPAIELARREEAAYHSLRPVQGSFFPHCYGFHVFYYPSGWKAYGTVIELIPGEPSFYDTLVPLNDEEVIKSVIRNLRHAVRILRYADIYQTDWNDGQCIFRPQEGTGVLVPVLIDFAFALQSEVGYDVRLSDDVYRVRKILGKLLISEEILDEVWLPNDRIEM